MEKKIMIELPFTEEMLLRAKKRLENIFKDSARRGGNFKQNTILKNGSEAGLLFEEAFLEYFPESSLVNQTGESRNKFNYDIIFQGKKCELKAVLRTVKPSPDYVCSVNAYTSKHQIPDMYIFSSIQHKDYVPKTITLVGCLSREDFYRKAKFLKEGDRDFNNIVKKDKYNVLISQLDDIIINRTHDGIDWDSV